MVSDTKLINAFSPAYVSQIEPFRYTPLRRPSLKPLPSLDSINTVSDSAAEQKRFKLLKPSI